MVAASREARHAAAMDLRKFVKVNGVLSIIIERLDCLARELFIQEHILRDLKQRGAALVSVTEQYLDSDPTRVLFRQIMGAIAQYDRTMTVLKLRAARRRMKATSGRCEGAEALRASSWRTRDATAHALITRRRTDFRRDRGNPQFGRRADAGSGRALVRLRTSARFSPHLAIIPH